MTDVWYTDVTLLKSTSLCAESAGSSVSTVVQIQTGLYTASYATLLQHITSAGLSGEQHHAASV